MAPRGDGALVVFSGRYYEPVVTLTDHHVVSYSLTHFLPDEQAVNQYVPSYTDPNSEFTTVDAGAVDHLIDQMARGITRSSQLALPWVPSASQAVRLAKRKLTRSTQELRGTITANLYGMNALGERYVRLQVSENAAISDVVVEITDKAQIDLANLTVTFPFVAADPTIDDGDPGGSVSIPGVPVTRPIPSPLVAPTITSLAAVYDDSASGISGARIQIDISAPVTEDVQWRYKWKLSAASDWHENTSTDIADGAAITLLTAFVPATGSVDVEVAYVTAGGVSPWSATSSISLAAPAPAATSIQASEAIAAKAFVNIYDASGSMRVRRADATNPAKFANGFAPAAISSGASGEVRRSGVNAVTIATTSSRVWLSETVPGGYQTSAPTADGSINQPLGVAIPGVGIDFSPQPFAMN